MHATLALAVRMVGGISIDLRDLYRPDCPALVEVDLYCRHYNTGQIGGRDEFWAVHALPVRPDAYAPYCPTNAPQSALVDLLGAAQ